MQIHTSSMPHIQAAQALSNTLEQHKNTPVLLLLAGGSALKVLDGVSVEHINEYTTIMMMDERFSTHPAENNFLQMTQTLFYTKLTSTQCNFIASVPEESESHSVFTKRIGQLLTQYLAEHTNTTVISLFGIGPDGHTAAIFPMKKTQFIDTYGQGSLYTQVLYSKNPFSRRTTITPKFIKNHITKSFVYAVGEQKSPILSIISIPHELHKMPAHIHQLIDSTIYTNQSL